MLRRIFVINVFLILSALVLSCGGGSNPTSPDNGDESVNILGYSYPKFVPSLIVFSRMLPNGNSYNNTNSELFVINPSGQFDNQLTFNAADDDFPAFNPGGNKVAFVSNRSSGGYGSHDIFWLGPVGYVVQLTDDTWQWNASSTQWPVWGAITASRHNLLVMAPFDVGQVFAVSPWGNWETYVYSGVTMPYDQCYSPVSGNLVVSGRPNGMTYMDDIELFLKPQWLDYSYRITYFGDDSEDPMDLVYTTDPDFDYTGQKILFQTTYWDNNTEIGMVDLSTADAIPQPVRLTNNDAADCEPSWDPTGKWFVWATDRDGNFELYKKMLYDPDNPGPEPTPIRLTYTDEDEHNPDWGPAYGTNTGY